MKKRPWRNAGRTLGSAALCGCLTAVAPQGMTQVLPPSEACAADPFQAPGQEYAIGGTADQVSTTFNRKSQQPDMNLLFPSSEGTPNFPEYVNTPANVAVDLLVIDHNDANPVIVDLTPFTTTIAYLRHGQLVVAHIRALLESAGYKSEAPSWLSYSNGKRRINIVLRAPESVNPAATPAKSLAVVKPPEIDKPRNIKAVVLPNSFTGLLNIPTISGSTGTRPVKNLQMDYNISRFLSNYTTLPTLEKSLAEYYLREISYGTPDRAIQSSPTIINGRTRSPNLIINMSLAIIKCGTLREYTEARNKKSEGLGITYTLKEYFRDHAKINGENLDVIQRQAIEIPQNSPFMKQLAEYLIPAPGSHIIAVAASGNYGLDYSTAPGSLPNVISVGARTVNWEQPGPPYWSNRSDVLSLGVGFTLTAEQIRRFCDEGETCIAADIKPNTPVPELYQTFVYNGTSFAAPSVSAFLATRIGNNACFNQAGPLGFKPIQSKSQKFEFRGDWIYQPCDSSELVPPLKPAPKISTPPG